MDGKDFKVGEFVVITKKHGTNQPNVGQLVEIMEIDESTTPFRVRDTYQNYGWSVGQSWCKGVRKLTESEAASIGKFTNYDIY